MAENNTYEPENDTNLVTDLTQNDVYSPENDLNLTQSLVSTPTLPTTTGSANASGDTLNISGTSTLDTVTANANASGEPDIFLTTGLFTVRKATANASGDTISLSGSSTLDTTAASANASGSTLSILDTNFDTVTANANGSGSTGLNLVIPPIGTTTASANATGGQTQFAGLLGNGGEITVLINGERIDTYTNIEIKKRLNEVDTFSFNAFITDSNDRSLINEGNTVKFIENYDKLLFKGRLTEVEYKSDFRAKCEGDGMVTKLLNRKTDRETFTNTAGDDIVKSVVDNTYISYGSIESAPQVSVRFDHDNEARAVAGVANATGYDWFIDQDPTDNWDTDRLNFVQNAGRDTVQETFDIGGNAQMVERNKDDGFVANDITLLGRGDGINQLEARVFACSTAYTDTTQIINENETGSFTVNDTTQLGNTGDNLIVRIGLETMDVTISDATTLSINNRAVNDYEGNSTEQIKHYDGIRVWRLENKTQGIGRFTPETVDSAEDGSSIESNGVKEQRETDKTIVDLSTLEKAADLELKNRFEDVFRIQVQPTEPRVTEDLQLGDKVQVEDLTAMDVSNDFNIVQIDIMRSSAEEGTVLHLANRPRRLTERLSEIESNTDTLNAHMQGATNFNGEHFEDNCDNTHPLNNKIYIPDDVVSINKFNVVFARESFRGYVQNEDHSHSVTVTHPSHSHSVTFPDHDHFIDIDPHTHDVDIEQHDHAYDVIEHDHLMMIHEGSVSDRNINESFATFEQDGSIGSGQKVYLAADTSADKYTGGINNDDGDAFTQNVINGKVQTSEAGGGISTTTANGGGTTESSTTELGTSTSETTDNSGAPSYGIFEPFSEPNVDVEVRVDGNLVTTINDVSVGQEQTTPIDLKQDLAEPLTGSYHDVTLTPVDTGGGNNGRCKLVADVNEKVFIESTL